MVLDFPVMADYATLFDETGRELFLTHGHVFGAGMHNSVDHAPALPGGSALVYGDTTSRSTRKAPRTRACGSSTPVA